MGKNLYNKVFDKHAVKRLPSGQYQLFIGLHMIHEVTSPQAFEMLDDKGWGVKYPNRTFATVDHIIPTDVQTRPLKDELLSKQIRKNPALNFSTLIAVIKVSFISLLLSKV